MTALQSHPSPENPDKGENPGAWEDGAEFLPFSPFPGPGMAQNAAPSRHATVALAAVRAYRRPLPPEPPRAPRRKPDADRARPRAGGSSPVPDAPPPAAPTPPGVPPEWYEGVVLLAARSAPDTIPLRRWTVLAATSARLLRDHGAALYGTGWNALDLFGLHPTAPMTHPPGWGLAWLLGEHGEVLDISAGVVGMRRKPDGARLAYQWPGKIARAGMVPAWQLIEVAT